MSNSVFLTDSAANILKRGGSDNVTDDQMLLMEIVSRAPGMSQEDLKKCFIACRMEYGEDALKAIRSGHVRFEERVPGRVVKVRERT